jgi:hypothetical protein
VSESDDGLQALMPALTRLSESERDAFVARLEAGEDTEAA